jgi:membrane protease YdiL (CAAX protease family)
MAPIVEEFVFRFLLCKPIEQKYKWLGVIVSGVLFGGMHLVASIQSGTFIQDLPSLVSYVGMGLVLGYRYKTTDNIASNMIAHGMYNTMSFILILFM